MSPLLIAAAVVVGVLSAARLTRLLTQDDFPPVAWARAKWDDATEDSSWNSLMHCHYCMGFWTFSAVLASALLTDLHTWWWIANGALAGAYLTSIVVQHDEGIVIVKES